MKKACEPKPIMRGLFTLLSVGLIGEDHDSLERHLDSSLDAIGPKCEWRLSACRTLASALK